MLLTYDRAGGEEMKWKWVRSGRSGLQQFPGARAHFRVKAAAAHYKEGGEKLFALSEPSKLAWPPVSSSAQTADEFLPSLMLFAFVFATQQQAAK